MRVAREADGHDRGPSASVDDRGRRRMVVPWPGRTAAWPRSPPLAPVVEVLLGAVVSWCCEVDDDVSGIRDHPSATA